MTASPIRTHEAAEFPLEALLEAKGHTSVSVCIPARNEETTVGAIVDTIREVLVEPGLVDEIVVIDDHSDDATAAEATTAGAVVVRADEVLLEHGAGHGQGRGAVEVAVRPPRATWWCGATPTCATSTPPSSPACSDRCSPTRRSGS